MADTAQTVARAEIVTSSMTVEAGEARLDVFVMGTGAPVVFIPSLARGVEDFHDLAGALAANGRTAALPQARGIGRSTGPAPGSLADLADDVAAVIDAVGGTADVIGHAFGQRVARMLAARHPAKVRSLVLLACGGHAEMPADVRANLVTSLSQGIADDDARLEAMRRVFFAKGNDANVWLDGWTPAVAPLQSAATRASDVAEWWGGGEAPMLIVQAAEDPIAPVAASEALKAEAGARATLVTLPHASHAILPEQPEAVVAVVQAYLGGARDERALQAIVDRAVRAPAVAS
ncbi:MAG: alpha/beta fold hydrolase [Proteobacteria bacterium]|nr:alpha/beta fold hydrolase [Pseudomonadota bacterium]